MKRSMTILCVALVSGTALSAQETADTINVETKDTLVVIVKQEKADAFFEKTGKPFKKGYKAVNFGKSYQFLCFYDEGFLLNLNTFASSKRNTMSKMELKTGKVEETVVNAYKKIEKGVVSGYQAIEDAVVGTYQKIEDKFVEKFLEVEEEVIEVPEEGDEQK